eukprot:6708618-Pyramimonas_sp.AAC.1
MEYTGSVHARFPPASRASRNGSLRRGARRAPSSRCSWHRLNAKSPCDPWGGPGGRVPSRSS